MAKKCAVRSVEMRMKNVKDSDGKTQKRHVVTAHFHPKKAQGGKGMKGAFPDSTYMPPETTEHEDPSTAKGAMNSYADKMEPADDDSPY